MQVSGNGASQFDVEFCTVRDDVTGQWWATLYIYIVHGGITVYGLSPDRLRHLGQMALRTADELDRLAEEPEEQ